MTQSNINGPVLCPVDLGHEPSLRAVPEAVRQAKVRGVNLHLLAVIPDPGAMMVAEYLPTDFMAKAAEKAIGELKALQAQHAGSEVVCETHVGHGHAAEQIIEFADRVSAGLIVMTSHAPDRLRTLLVGSVADKIVHNSNHSVLIIR